MVRKKLLFLCFVQSLSITVLFSGNTKVIDKPEIVNKSKVVNESEVTDKPEVGGKVEVIDKIVARVNGANILQSDLNKPRLNKNGQYYSLEEMINEELMCQKATERKLTITSLEVEKQISNLKVYNNLSHLSDSEFEEELKKEGLTLTEYKNQLARMLACEKLKHAEFSERVVVTSQEVEQYHKDNPEREHERYLIKMFTVPRDCIDDKGNLIKKVNYKWDDLGWIEKKELSDSLAFVSKMKVNQISKPKKMGLSYQMVKLADKKSERLKTLDERYQQIDLMLQQQKKARFEQEFKKELMAKAYVRYIS